MSQKVASRSQRRMERKHAMVLFVVVLVVALASFSLGVMVGRSGQHAVTVAPVSQPVVLPKIAEPTPVPAETAPASAGAEESKLPEEKLTFYDTLPRGGQPLGSGINLPPETAKPEAEPAPVDSDPVARLLPAAEKKQAAAPAPVAKAEKAVQASTPAKVPVPAGSFIVQVASFQKVDQAQELSKRLAGKGYVAFVKQADLGSKGVWHRVYAGPYSERALADKAAERLRSEEKFSPLVRKQ